MSDTEIINPDEIQAGADADAAEYKKAQEATQEAHKLTVHLKSRENLVASDEEKKQLQADFKEAGNDLSKMVDNHWKKAEKDGEETTLVEVPPQTEIEPGRPQNGDS